MRRGGRAGQMGCEEAPCVQCNESRVGISGRPVGSVALMMTGNGVAKPGGRGSHMHTGRAGGRDKDGNSSLNAPLTALQDLEYLDKLAS